MALQYTWGPEGLINNISCRLSLTSIYELSPPLSQTNVISIFFRSGKPRRFQALFIGGRSSSSCGSVCRPRGCQRSFAFPIGRISGTPKKPGFRFRFRCWSGRGCRILSSNFCRRCCSSRVQRILLRKWVQWPQNGGHDQRQLETKKPIPDVVKKVPEVNI